MPIEVRHDIAAMPLLDMQWQLGVREAERLRREQERLRQQALEDAARQEQLARDKMRLDWDMQGRQLDAQKTMEQARLDATLKGKEADYVLGARKLNLESALAGDKRAMDLAGLYQKQAELDSRNQRAFDRMQNDRAMQQSRDQSNLQRDWLKSLWDMQKDAALNETKLNAAERHEYEKAQGNIIGIMRAREQGLITPEQADAALASQYSKVWNLNSLAANRLTGEQMGDAEGHQPGDTWADGPFIWQIDPKTGMKAKVGDNPDYVSPAERGDRIMKWYGQLVKRELDSQKANPMVTQYGITPELNAQLMAEAEAIVDRELMPEEERAKQQEQSAPAAFAQALGGPAAGTAMAINMAQQQALSKLSFNDLNPEQQQLVLQAIRVMQYAEQSGDPVLKQRAADYRAWVLQQLGLG